MSIVQHTVSSIGNLTDFVGKDLPYIGAIVGMGYGMYQLKFNKEQIKLLLKEHRMNQVATDESVSVLVLGLPTFLGYFAPKIVHRAVTSPILQMVGAVYGVSKVWNYMDKKNMIVEVNN